MRTIIVKDEFTEYPGLRHCEISDDSGEEFYHKVLNKAFKEALDNKEKLLIDLDGTAGYAPSFVDESFGNLIFDFTKEIVVKTIEFKSLEEPSWIKIIREETFVEWEQRRKQDTKPKITGVHEDWYRLNGDQVEHGKWT